MDGDKQLDLAFTVSNMPVYAFATGDAGSSFVEYGVVNFTKDEIVFFSLSFDGNWSEFILAQFIAFEPVVKKIITTVRFQ